MSAQRLVALLFIAATAACTAASADPQATASALSAQPPPELLALAGHYDGAWTISGVDAMGNTKTVSSWTDSLDLGNPVVLADRAYISATDHMTFASGGTHDQDFAEGFFLNADGSLGDRYYVVSGQTVRETPIADHVFTFAQTASPQELASLGFMNAASGEHVTTEVITFDADGADVSRLTRVTTVHWKDGAGQDRWTQAVTLQGFHRHTRP
jgi:hypothetical protein